MLQDSMGQSALHVSISCQQSLCSVVLLSHADLDLTIKDKSGHTPFAKAMAVKDDEAGRAILKREPKAAEQVWVCVRACCRWCIIYTDLIVGGELPPMTSPPILCDLAPCTL